MKHFTKLILCFFLLPVISSYSQTKADSVVVLPLSIAPPADARKIGSLKAGNNATASNCDYEGLIRELKEKAAGMGGNIVKLTRLIPPAFISKCYKVTADVYNTPILPDYAVKKAPSLPVAAGNESFATLYIYRLPDTLALEGNYQLHLNNDSVLCQIRSRFHDSFKIYSDGSIKLWAEKEKKAELKINVKKGAAYFVRCGLMKGEIRLFPVLELMDDVHGRKEFEKLKKKKKDLDVKYLGEIH